MTDREHFWRLEHLSDGQLLDRLQSVLRTHRYTLAELVAHLGEVEERRLHLAAAHGSMFSYCVQKLGMSEDEACRRIELARLARKFPLLFDELAGGRINLSVALLLKPVLTLENQAELIAAARGASLRSAREMLAVRFPSPDVPSRIRKLPERLVPSAMPAACVAAANPTPAGIGDIASAMPAPAIGVVPTQVTTPGGSTGTTADPSLASSQQLPRCSEFQFCSRIDRPRIDPLSAERYRIQFTADVDLKQKLELARDLLRHSHPSGDLAAVVSRALDLLLNELLQRRFGARRKDALSRPARPASQPVPVAPPTATAQPINGPQSSPAPMATRAPAPPAAAPSMAPPSGTASSAATSPRAATSPLTAPSSAGAPSSRIARPARRAVLERDGLGCCWVDLEGKRCNNTAWLELDHRQPSGKGGGSEPHNLRLLCRAHNRFAAECAYGREHMERAIQARQRSAQGHCQGSDSPSSSPPA
jgi:hypothetical protein